MPKRGGGGRGRGALAIPLSQLRFRIEDGDWFDLASVEIRSYRQTLDLRDGILIREIRAEEIAQLFARLGYEFDPESIPRNVEYYGARTSQGSTLSRVVDAWVLARSDRPRSWSLFTEALESDVADIQGGTTSEGIHLGATAGTVDLIQRCYTGIEVRDQHLWLNPTLPEELRGLRIRVRCQGQTIELDISHDLIRVRAVCTESEAMRLHVDSEVVSLATGETMEIKREGKTVYVDAP